MLILTRRIGERLFIGDNIWVQVMGFKGNQVQLGIDAPSHIGVLREELIEKAKKEEQAA